MTQVSATPPILPEIPRIIALRMTPRFSLEIVTRNIIRLFGDAGILFLLFFPFLEVRAADIEQKLVEMTFEAQTHDWRANRFCRMTLKDGSLFVQSQGGTPMLFHFMEEIGGQIRVVLKIRTQTESRLVAFWTTKASPRRSDDKSTERPLKHDGHWHDYEIMLPVSDVLTGLSLQFEGMEGVWEIRSISAFRKRPHPLVAEQIVFENHPDPDGVVRERLRYTIRNEAAVPLVLRGENLQKESVELPGRQTLDFAVPVHAEGNLAAVNLSLQPEGFPAVSFPVFLYRPGGKTDWLTRSFASPEDGLTLEIAPDARMARILKGDREVALIAPLVHRAGTIPQLRPVASTSASVLRFEGPEATLQLTLDADSIRIQIDDLLPLQKNDAEGSGEPLPFLEGPVVRLPGTLKSGLLPGVEFLGPGDRSSSTIDLAEPYNERSLPDPLWITFPLAVLETENGGIAMRWNDMTLQPGFSSPNRFDRTDDHRMSLQGRKIDATLLWLEPRKESTDESASLRALRIFVAQQGFPEPPETPRTPEEQAALSLQALQVALQSQNASGWGYATEEVWPRRPYADMLSTLARLSGRIPRTAEIVSGGADIANDAIYFLTDRVDAWRASREEVVRSLLSLQNPDGSFFYRTRFSGVESSATSIGYTAVRSLEVMELAHLTGERDLFEAIRPSLGYLERADVPRGGFYQDSPLHTPDLLTAATMIWLHIWAFEFSGEKSHLDQARRFAYAGLPFVYLWSDRENMTYLTVSKFGGTQRQLPLAFGTARPNVGILYAYALDILAPHDPSVDWPRLSRGILHAAERLQYTVGPEAGCLPEAFDIQNQQRLSWKVNPCSLVSLRNALDGKPNALYVTVTPSGRYVSPYLLRQTSTGLEAVDVPQGQQFQILRNGYRTISADGPGPVPPD